MRLQLTLIQCLSFQFVLLKIRNENYNSMAVARGRAAAPNWQGQRSGRNTQKFSEKKIKGKKKVAMVQSSAGIEPGTSSSIALYRHYIQYMYATVADRSHHPYLKSGNLSGSYHQPAFCRTAGYPRPSLHTQPATSALYIYKPCSEAKGGWDTAILLT